MEDRTVPEQKRKLVADEQTFAKLLEAAYVLQEHNREMKRLELVQGLKRDETQPRSPGAPIQNYAPLQIRKPTLQQIPNSAAQDRSTGRAPSSDPTSTLERIAETQRQIQVRRMEFESALQLVVERVCEMTNAVAAAIGIIEGKSVRYRAVTGSSAPSLESVLPLDKAMFTACLKDGQVFRSPDTTKAVLLNTNECKRRGIGSLIAVPVYHDGGIAGGLELYHASPNAFTESDVHACQLMAGLVAEALVREEVAIWRKSLATERAAMLAALEKLQPNLAALTEKPAAKTLLDSQPAASLSCRKCGHQLEPEEQFCGQCGSPRAADYEAPNLQSKVASLWHMQESQKKGSAPESGDERFETPAEKAPSAKPQEFIVRSLERQIPELFAPEDSEDLELTANEEAVQVPAPIELQQISGYEHEDIALEVSDEEHLRTVETSDEAPAKSEAIVVANWSSAASARSFLEQFSSSRRLGTVLKFWNRHRGDIYLGIAVILVLCVIRWGIWSSPGAKATGVPATANATHRKPTRDAGLSLFDRMLIELGLAEAPDPPQDQGNPGVQVWVDQRTALYYCPGADLYGKTPKGRFTTQRQAQLDQFEPASRKACD